MRLLDELLDRAVAMIPAALHEGVVVFGSAPMVFAGLKPDVTVDLDLFVSERVYEALRGAGFVEDRDERGMKRVMVAEGVEVVKEWAGARFEEVLEESAEEEGSRGLRVAGLEHVLAWKASSEREKDRVEAEVIQQWLDPTLRPAPVCPGCGGSDVIPIVWGEPTDEAFEDAAAGRVALGGCAVTGGEPDWHCKGCGREFGGADGCQDRRRG